MKGFERCNNCSPRDAGESVGVVDEGEAGAAIFVRTDFVVEHAECKDVLGGASGVTEAVLVPA